MAVVVVDEGEAVIVVFAGEAEVVFGEEVAVGDAGGAEGTGDGAEGGVVVMGGDAVLEGMVRSQFLARMTSRRVAMGSVGSQTNSVRTALPLSAFNRWTQRKLS